jgi:hypothetical protein
MFQTVNPSWFFNLDGTSITHGSPDIVLGACLYIRIGLDFGCLQIAKCESGKIPQASPALIRLALPY